MNQPQRHRDTELKAVKRTTERIIGCAIEVHRVLGCGLFESVYRAALYGTFKSEFSPACARRVSALEI